LTPSDKATWSITLLPTTVLPIPLRSPLLVTMCTAKSGSKIWALMYSPLLVTAAIRSASPSSAIPKS